MVLRIFKFLYFPATILTEHFPENPKTPCRETSPDSSPNNQLTAELQPQNNPCLPHLTRSSSPPETLIPFPLSLLLQWTPHQNQAPARSLKLWWTRAIKDGGQSFRSLLPFNNFFFPFAGHQQLGANIPTPSITSEQQWNQEQDLPDHRELQALRTTCRHNQHNANLCSSGKQVILYILFLS